MMEEVKFHCGKCKKSMKMSYEVTGENDALVMNGITLKCHTNKCIRVVRLKKYTEGKILSRTNAQGICYL